MIGQSQIVIALVVACVYSAFGAPQTMIVNQDSSNGLDGQNYESGLNALQNQNEGPVMIVGQSSRNGLKGVNGLEGANLLSNKNENGGVPALPPAPCSGGAPGIRCRTAAAGLEGYGNVAAWKASYVIPSQVVASKVCDAPPCASAPAAPAPAADPKPCESGACAPVPPPVEPKPCDSGVCAPAAPPAVGFSHGGYSSSYKHAASSSSSSSEDHYDVTRFGAAAVPR